MKTEFQISNNTSKGISREIRKLLEECYFWGNTSEVGVNISWFFFINVLFIFGFCFIYENIIILRDSFLFLQTWEYFFIFLNKFFHILIVFQYSYSKRFNLTPCITKRNHMWKFYLMFFFCYFIIDSYSFWRSSTKEIVLRREPENLSLQVNILSIEKVIDINHAVSLID